MKNYKTILIIFILIFFSCDSSAEPESYDGLIDEAFQAFTNKNYDLAIIKFNDAKSLDNGRIEAYLGLGWSYVLKIDFTNAISELNQAMSIDDTNPDIHASLAFIHNANGSNSLSNTEILTLISIDPNWSFAYGLNLSVTDLIVIQAQNYFLLGDYSNALLSVQQIEPLFTVNVNTDVGILELSAKIESYNPGL